VEEEGEFGCHELCICQSMLRVSTVKSSHLGCLGIKMSINMDELDPERLKVSGGGLDCLVHWIVIADHVSRVGDGQGVVKIGYHSLLCSRQRF